MASSQHSESTPPNCRRGGCSPHPSRGRQHVHPVEYGTDSVDAARTPHGDSKKADAFQRLPFCLNDPGIILLSLPPVSAALLSCVGQTAAEPAGQAPLLLPPLLPVPQHRQVQKTAAEDGSQASEQEEEVSSEF